jgi:hypothetical protein
MMAAMTDVDTAAFLAVAIVLPAHPRRIRSTRLFGWALCVAVTASVFALTLRDGFGSDDFTWLAWARRAGLADILGAFKLWKVGHEMPLMHVAFSLQYSLFGLHASGYRLMSIGVHAINVILVYEIGRRILRSPRPALLAALLFAVQPAHSQAVMWDGAVQHLLATAFYLGALLAEVGPPVASATWRLRTLTARGTAGL